MKWLLKWSVAALIGVAVVEFVRGMMQNLRDRNSGGDDLDRALNEDPGRMMNMTGPARGEMMETHDADGATSPHLVGRGVVTS